MKTLNKKFFGYFTCITLLLCLLVGCGSKSGNSSSKDSEDEILKFEKEYYSLVDTAVEEARSLAKTPSSVEIHSIYVYKPDEYDPVVFIYLSAKNGFGGTKDHIVQYSEKLGFAAESSNDVKEYMSDEYYKNKLSSTFYCDSKDLKKSKGWIFKVNLDD